MIIISYITALLNVLELVKKAGGRYCVTKNHIRPLSSGDLYSYTLYFVYRTLYPLQDIFEGSKVLAAIMKPTIPSDKLKQDLILSLIIASSFDKSQPSRDGMPIADSSESILTGNGNAWAKPLYRQGKDVFPFLSVFLFIYYFFCLQRKDPIRMKYA